MAVSAALFLALSTNARAQFGVGQKYLGAHVGLSGVGSAAALGVNGEVAYNENIGIGAWFDTWSYGYDYSGLGGGTGVCATSRSRGRARTISRSRRIPGWTRSSVWRSDTTW
jgi:hypothetical protein